MIDPSSPAVSLVGSRKFAPSQRISKGSPDSVHRKFIQRSVPLRIHAQPCAANRDSAVRHELTDGFDLVESKIRFSVPDDQYGVPR